ncbi:MAG: TlpA family protein disulfide reductase [Proteobacteria bacterium]|nr:TlpA family protein disulfide reductase [Pseudomonadota bacterium]
MALGPSAKRPPHIALEPLLLSSRSLTAAILGLALLIGGCDRQSGGEAQPQASGGGGPAPLDGVINRAHRGSVMPDFTLKDASGKELRLASLKGKPVLINLWATWCAPCVAELPSLNALAQQRGDSLRIITVSQDMAKLETVAPFLKDKAPLLQPWLDPEGQLTTFYDTTILPTSIYYDAQGREVWRYIGPRHWDHGNGAAMLAETIQ